LQVPIQATGLETSVRRPLKVLIKRSACIFFTSKSAFKHFIKCCPLVSSRLCRWTRTGKNSGMV